MNVLVIPSWYPSDAYPSTGIFFREQARLMAVHRPHWKVGISLWGSHEPALWLKATRPLASWIKYRSKPPLKRKDTLIEANCAAFFAPAFTWTRKIRNGNFEGILRANVENFERHSAYFGRPNLIHAHVAYPAGMIARELSRRYGIPYLVTEHMSPFPMESFRSDYQKRLLPALRDAGQVLAVSEALCQRLGELGVHAARISNFIDDQLFTHAGQSFHHLSIIAVGRLEPQKNYHSLLEALALLREQISDFQVKIVGSGAEERTLRRQAETLGLHQIEWLGEVPQQEVAAHLQQSTVLVNTSLHENQPVAILEAMACGVPMISYDWSGSEELVKSGAGEVIPSNPEALAEKLVQISQAPYTPEAVRAIFDQHFATEKVISRLEQYYRSLL